MNKFLILISFILLTGCFNKNSDESGKEVKKEQKAKTYYTCSMHPNIKEHKPGKCPICHMNLTQVEEMDEHDHSMEEKKISQKTLWQCENYPDITSEVQDTCPIDGTPMIAVSKSSKAQEIIAKVRLKKSQLRHFKPNTFPVTTMAMVKKIRVLGLLKQSEDRESKIAARISGRVEKVYVKSKGAFIKKNDPVLELYSPKLITAGEEYLIAQKSFLKRKNQDNLELLEQSKKRLLLWGMTQKQLEQWSKKQKIPSQIKIYSQETGIIQKLNAKKGRYFKEGENFFELSDLTSLWVELDIYEHDSALVSLGQKVKIHFNAIPGKKFESEIDFINPVLDPSSRTLKVRATIDNADGKLKPGMIADALIKVELEGRPLVVPRSAIIDTGKRKVAWVKKSGDLFEAKIVQTGHEFDGYTEVKSGLLEDEEVVLDGNFLLDAQAQLFGGYELMNKSKPAHQH